jgi:SAM-dependent methyltransferase
MSFNETWLDLREPADRAARDPALIAAARAHLAGVAEPLAVDLGCGTGAMSRALAAPGLRWRLLDRDPALLSVAAQRCGPAADTVAADLGEVDQLPIDGARLVTASAILDLVSAGWVEAMADRLATERIAFYACMSFDGRVIWNPIHPDDDEVAAAFNIHQNRDKGLGPALGAAGSRQMAAALERRGFDVQTADSPWRLRADQQPLIAEFAEGIAAAANETGLATAAWLQARRAASDCTVGHVDLLAVPAGARAQSKTTSEARP